MEKQESEVTQSKYNNGIMTVLGSAAEVENFWSAAGHVVISQRACMSPLVFELIMYLKYNANF